MVLRFCPDMPKALQFAPHPTSQSRFLTATSPWTLCSTFSGLLRDAMFPHTLGLCIHGATLPALLISLANPSWVPSSVEPSPIFCKGLIASPLYSPFLKPITSDNTFSPSLVCKYLNLSNQFLVILNFQHLIRCLALGNYLVSVRWKNEWVKNYKQSMLCWN